MWSNRILDDQNIFLDGFPGARDYFQLKMAEISKKVYISYLNVL